MTRCNLAELNRRLSSHPLTRFLGVAVFVVALTSYLTYFHARFGLNVPPWSSGDEPSYDSLGWQLSRGRGFTLNFGDQAFRAPYEKAEQHDPARPPLDADVRGPTTVRPPLFPLLIAGTNMAFGRQFWAVRLLNAAAMAASGALLAQFLLRRVGLLPALIGVVSFVLIDYRTRLFGRAILTEAAACLLVALLTLTLIAAARSGKTRWAVTAGILAGLAMLTRNIIALWLPVLGILLLLSVRRSTSGDTQRRPIVHASAFLAAAQLVAAPWMIRNCLVLDSFKPLGSQGMIELSAGYSDAAFARGGVWHNMAEQGFFDDVVRPGMTALAAERAMAAHSSQQAFRWIRRNPRKALLLTPLKIWNEFRPYRLSEAFILIAALTGLAVAIKSPGGRACGGLLIANAVAVALTWSVSGRFLVPLLFVFHVTAAVGLWSMLLFLTNAPRGEWKKIEL